MDALKELVEKCLGMDITDQILAFGDPWLPNRAAKELAALLAPHIDHIETLPGPEGRERVPVVYVK